MKKILKYINTLRFLRPIQFFYRLRYTIFGFRSIKMSNRVIVPQNVNILLEESDCEKTYVDRFNPDSILKNNITLLNEIVKFTPGKWKYEEQTHLWNFNLHYFEYAISLGVRYKQTNDKKYYKKYRELYLDWLENNNTFHNDAWHPYTISLRIVNILVANELFSTCIKTDKDFYEKINKSLYWQFLFLEKNKELHLLGNHYFENIKTLYIASVYFNDQHRQKKYAKKIISVIKEQVLPDGMHYELSFMYQNILVEGLLRVYQCCLDYKFKETLKQYISLMLDASNFIEQKNNRLPLFNDSGEDVAKSIVSLNASAESLFDYTYKNNVKALEYAGYYRLDSDGYSVVIDCGKVGADEQPGHAHCDALSFELFVNGKPLIVNSGTYQYQSKLRSYFRSTKAHNTLVINEHEQSECWAEHRVGRRIKNIRAEIRNNTCTGSFINIYGEMHTRSIKFENNKFGISDFVKSKNLNSVEGFLHIDPEYDCTKIDENQVLIVEKNNGKPLFNIRFTEINSLIIHNNDDYSYYSEKMGELLHCTTLNYTWRNNCTEQEIIIEAL